MTLFKRKIAVNKSCENLLFLSQVYTSFDRHGKMYFILILFNFIIFATHNELQAELKQK